MDGRVAGSDQTLSPEEAIWRAIFSPDKPLNLGPYLLGGMVDVALWGIMFQQAVQWFIRHRQRRQDRLMDKIMVCWMTVFGTFITVVTVSWIWQLFVVTFGLYAPFASLQYIGWYPLLGFAIAAPSQLFYLDRAQSLSPTKWLPILCILLIIGNLATAIVQRVQFWHLQVNDIQDGLHTTYAFISTAVATDLLLTFRILYILYRKRSGEPLADKFITRLIRLVIESQSPPTLIAVIYLIMSGVNPKLTVIPFLIFMHNKVYIIPLFAVINSRRTIQKKMNLTTASNGTEMVSTTLPTSNPIETLDSAAKPIPIEEINDEARYGELPYHSIPGPLDPHSGADA